MKVGIDHLLLLVKEHGAEKALRYINIEDIEDHALKVIARTIQYSAQTFEGVIIDRIHERDALKGGSTDNNSIA